ncbi:MAG: hypothetical protein JW791_05420 [Nanoarchaeota archaeon]|nr:hypothetical protein [Nanoarchaeota archaeon]
MINAESFEFKGRSVNLKEEKIPDDKSIYLLEDASKVNIKGLDYFSAAEKICLEEIKKEYNLTETEARKYLDLSIISRDAAFLYLNFNNTKNSTQEQLDVIVNQNNIIIDQNNSIKNHNTRREEEEFKTNFEVVQACNSLDELLEKTGGSVAVLQRFYLNNGKMSEVSPEQLLKTFKNIKETLLKNVQYRNQNSYYETLKGLTESSIEPATSSVPERLVYRDKNIRYFNTPEELKKYFIENLDKLFLEDSVKQQFYEFDYSFNNLKDLRELVRKVEVTNYVTKINEYFGLLNLEGADKFFQAKPEELQDVESKVDSMLNNLFLSDPQKKEFSEVLKNKDLKRLKTMFSEIKYPPSKKEDFENYLVWINNLNKSWGGSTYSSYNVTKRINYSDILKTTTDFLNSLSAGYFKEGVMDDALEELGKYEFNNDKFYIRNKFSKKQLRDVEKVISEAFEDVKDLKPVLKSIQKSFSKTKKMEDVKNLIDEILLSNKLISGYKLEIKNNKMIAPFKDFYDASMIGFYKSVTTHLRELDEKMEELKTAGAKIPDDLIQQLQNLQNVTIDPAMIDNTVKQSIASSGVLTKKEFDEKIKEVEDKVDGYQTNNSLILLGLTKKVMGEDE